MLKQGVDYLGNGIWRINEFSLVNAFVLEGSERSVIIDTGCGLGDIRKVVESVTQKPLSVLLTHMHPDHIGGIYHFPDCAVYAHGGDRGERIFGMENDNAFRRMYVESRGSVLCPDIYRSLFSLIPEKEPDSAFSFTAIGDGYELDLGGRRLRAIFSPGHTDGSLSFLDSQSGILFSGDTVNCSIILQRQENNGTALIEKYGATLSRLWSMNADFSSLAIGHGGPLLDKSIIADYLAMTEGLLSGSMSGSYEEKGFRKGDVLRYGKAELWYQCDR